MVQKKPYKLEDRDGRQVRVYESGQELDHVTGKIVKPALHTVITPFNASELVEAKRKRKHEKVAAAGNLVAQHALKHSELPELQALASDPDAYLMAVAIGRQKAAMDPDSPYANGAADWITKHSGNDEPRHAETQAPTLHVHVSGAGLARLAAMLDTVDGDVTETT